MTARFVPPHPPRGEGPVAVWRGLFGERGRVAVAGWSKRAFTLPYLGREVLGLKVHIPLDPELVQHVLLDNHAAYAKPDLVKKLLTRTVGEGLLSSDGELWREQRRIVASSFSPGAVDPLVTEFSRAATERMESWTRDAVIDMAAEATATTMRVISDTLFSGDERLSSDEAMAHIAAALAAVGDARLQLLLGLPLIPWNLRGLAGRRGQTFLRRTLSHIVAEHVAADRDDGFLPRLIRALRARFDRERADALAIDNAATFYLAGHETTANALTWSLFLLSRQPELQSELAAEARAALADPEGLPGLPERLTALRAVVEEALRLYPPVPRFDRQAIAPDRLGDHVVEPGDFVSIWPWLIHRHRNLWDDPDAFDPSRFASGTSGRHRFQYLPFGGGPRFCVGARFAMNEALTILAHWIAERHFAPASDRPVRLSGMVTLRPLGGLPLRVSARS